jgi:hypothetical protein
MKTNLFFYFIILLCTLGCKKSVDIVDPSIFIDSKEFNYNAYDSLRIYVVQSATVDGNEIPPDYFEWSIKKMPNGQVVFSQNSSSDQFYWVPKEEGKYLITVKIGYNGNKSITKMKDIVIMQSPNSLLKRISGTWKGAGETIFANFNVDTLIIHPDGKIHGFASNWNSTMGTYDGHGIFYMHMNEDRGDNFLTVNSVDNYDNVTGYVSVRNYDASNNSHYDYQMCLKYLKTNVTNDSLFIAVDEDFTCAVYPWYVRHKLVRVP